MNMTNTKYLKTLAKLAKTFSAWEAVQIVEVRDGSLTATNGVVLLHVGADHDGRPADCAITADQMVATGPTVGAEAELASDGTLTGPTGGAIRLNPSTYRLPDTVAGLLTKPDNDKGVTKTVDARQLKVLVDALVATGTKDEKGRILCDIAVETGLAVLHMQGTDQAGAIVPVERYDDAV